MSEVNLTDPIFHDEDKAREHFEKLGWPGGPFCPHCGETEKVYRLHGASHRPGLHHCNSCDGSFTIMTGGVMESSHLPLTKWALGFHLMASSKKGASAKQLQRQLGIGYRAAWFMAHRIRKAMAPATGGKLGGEGKIVEFDEIFVGGKKKNVHKGKPTPKKHAVHALVERGGHMRARHVADVTAKTLRKNLRKLAKRMSELHTDEALAYHWMGGREFSKHRAVNHSAGEYFRREDGAGVQGAESFFAIFKRGVYGSFHSVSEKHLQKYLDEFVFRWNTRCALGIEDTERAALAIKGARGKRLTYRQPDGAQAANNQTEV